MLSLSRFSMRAIPLRECIGGATKVRCRGIAASYPRRRPGKKEVPVASFTKRNAHDAERTSINVDNPPSSSSPVAEHNVGWKAVAFDRDVVRTMTPTMRKFTLEGKVAVVTGYVPVYSCCQHYLHFNILSCFASLPTFLCNNASLSESIFINIHVEEALSSLYSSL